MFKVFYMKLRASMAKKEADKDKSTEEEKEGDIIEMETESMGSSHGKDEVIKERKKEDETSHKRLKGALYLLDRGKSAHLQ